MVVRVRVAAGHAHPHDPNARTCELVVPVWQRCGVTRDELEDPGLIEAIDLDGREPADAEARAVVERERSEMIEFVKSLSADDIRSGGWFTRLLSHALSTYTDKVDWQYFQEKYHGMPADGIVEQRIRMAARYAAIEGGLSASAYTATIAATIGSAGGASPLTVPAAVTSVVVDIAYTSQLQLRLAYDISVLYRVPIDIDDPDDLWKLIRVAFTIKGGEVASEGVLKVVPAVVRPLIKAFYKKQVLNAAKGLPVVGKYLLQRNVIKIGIPVVGVPLAVVLNRYTTLVAGRHARRIFRNEAHLIEIATTLTAATRHPRSLLWVAWLVINADGKVSEDEATLYRHLVRHMEQQHAVSDGDLVRLIELDPNDVWRRLDAEEGDLGDLLDAARRIADVDGAANKKEKAVLRAVEERCLRN